MLDFGDNVAEDVTDGWPEQGKNDDYDYGDQYEDQSILYETLAFFFGSE
jgi:hypothetical protein